MTLEHTEQESTIYRLAANMLPEVREAAVENVHADFLARHNAWLDRVWMAGREPDLYAMVKAYHVLRSARAQNVLERHRFYVATLSEVITAVIANKVESLVKPDIGRRDFFGVLVQAGHYPQNVSDMLLIVLRTRSLLCPDETTWVLTDTHEPSTFLGTAGWPALKGHLAHYQKAKAPEGSLPDVVMDRTPWQVSTVHGLCSVCALPIPKGAKFAWANAVKVSKKKGQPVCAGCVTKAGESK